MTEIPYNYKRYLDDVTKMRQRGAISSGEQIASPSSAGSRGLAKLTQFTKDANQFMKANISESATRDYKNLPKEKIEELRKKYLPDWEYKDNSLQKRYKFEDYYETIKFLMSHTTSLVEMLEDYEDTNSIAMPIEELYEEEIIEGEQPDGETEINEENVFYAGSRRRNS